MSSVETLLLYLVSSTIRMEAKTIRSNLDLRIKATRRLPFFNNNMIVTEAIQDMLGTGENSSESSFHAKFPD